MKVDSSGKLLTWLAAVALLATTSSAYGAVIVRDEFNYPDGPLNGNVPEIGGVWTNHSGTLDQIQVVGGAARLVQTQSEDSHTDFAGGPIGAGTTIYAGFDLTVPSQANDPAVGYFAHFSNGGTFFGSRVFITAPALTGNGFRLGISGNSALDAAEIWPADLAFDTTYRVVHSYDYDSGASAMWIDPVDQLSPSVAAIDGFAGDEMQNYSLREFSAAAAGSSIQLIDCLQVATTFDEAAVCIPEPASAALIVLALGLVSLGRRTTR